MPEPISSSASPRLSCDPEDGGPLSCDSPLPPAASSAAAGANACLPSEEPVETALSSASSTLAQKFFRNDQASFVAASAPPSSSTSSAAPAPAPGSAPPARGWEVGDHFAALHRESHGTLAGVHLSASVDINSADAHLGSRNEDGSYGANFGVGRSLIEGKVSAEYHGWSLTLGASASEGFGISSGEGRDIDGDGIPERCFEMSLGAWTLGECDEL